jgi:hydrogenase 3 maturation protease
MRGYMKTAVMCIGNRDGGDDAVGPYIADNLSRTDTLFVLDCGTVPENFTSSVKQYSPTTLILIDATDMGLPPGTIRRIPKEKIGSMHVSTHNIPLSVLISYLEAYVDDIILIGIQPKCTEGTMSDEMKKAAKIVVTMIERDILSELTSL